jgi:hypothetical protein
MVKTISVKELRTNFPQVRIGLSKGITYLVIYQSKPIGQLKPVDPDNLKIHEATDQEVEQAAVNDIAQDSEEDLTEEELKYYMSLKDKNAK